MVIYNMLELFILYGVIGWIFYTVVYYILKFLDKFL